MIWLAYMFPLWILSTSRKAFNTVWLCSHCEPARKLTVIYFSGFRPLIDFFSRIYVNKDLLYSDDPSYQLYFVMFCQFVQYSRMVWYGVYSNYSNNYYTVFSFLVNNVKCSFCDMTCPTQSALQHHINFRHSNAKPFPCDMCENR